MNKIYNNRKNQTKFYNKLILISKIKIKNKWKFKFQKKLYNNT